MTVTPAPSGARNMILSVRGLSFSYRGRKHGHIQVLDNMDLDVAEGSFISLLGPSGCGKSTLFSIITGKLPAGSSERLDIREKPSYMPQKDLLLPWRTVLGNAVLAADLSGGDVEAAYEEARALIPIFGLSGFENYLPSDLSGGMKQRVALLRTVMQKRRFLVLDEPLGALDALTRAQMQKWLKEIKSELALTILMSTHDISEAISLSDEIYVLSARPARVVERITTSEIGGTEARSMIERAIGL